MRSIEVLQPLEQPLDVSGHKPFVIMIAGVNGAGKTTSIGKLAKYFQSQGKSVLLAAGDTFRAAAREQLGNLGRAQQRDRDRAGNGDPAPWSSTPSRRPRRVASTSCWPIPPAACRPNCT
jgi:fused signal recognition particle receptor